MTIANLFARIGLKIDKDKLNKFKKSLKSAQAGLVMATAKAALLTAGIKLLAEQAYDAARALKQLEVETGVSIDKFQVWASVADQVSNSANAVTSAIKAISSNQAKIRLGQGNISGYQLLGIDPRQDPFQILEELRSKLPGLSQDMKKTVLSQLGISSELMQTLALTNDQFDEMAGRAYIMPKTAIDSIDKARKSSRVLLQSLNYLKNMIIAKIAPGIEKFNKVTKRTVDLLLNFINHVDEVISKTIGWEKAIYILLVVIGLLNLKLLTSPVGLFTLSIIALLLVLEDLYVYSKGGKSLFGHLMKKFPGFEDKLFKTITTFKDLITLLKGFSADKMTEEMDKILEKWGLLGDALKGIVASLKFIRGGENPFKAGTYVDLKRIPKADKILKNISEDQSKKGTFPGPGNKADDIDYNLTQNIYGSSDPEATANFIDRHLQQWFNVTSAQRVKNE